MLRAAAIQLNSTEDFERNRERAEALVREAVADGAGLVVLPEKWNRLGESEAMAAGAEPLDGPATGWARALARELRIDLVAGSITERAGDVNHNTSVHVDPGGEVRAAYRKLHLFDVEVEGTSYRESDSESPGEEIVDSHLADGTGLGLTVCYDVRFPELFRELGRRGVRVIAVPAAFTEPTTRDHWEPVLRTRAIENQVFVVAANQVGEHGPGKRSGGRSMIVDPWGTILAEGPGDAEAVVAADLDFARQDQIRAEFPLLEHRRDDVYGGGVRV
ncbi:MAG TPA: carbon-nitrogen hydrolase family protein [Solirubrobacteraceae bacterium]|nr:carbon-nitrogen hydrolase family protein [Solirubrobacteraceae bacterium]